MKTKHFIRPIVIIILAVLAYVLYDKANQIHQSQALRSPSLHHLLGMGDLGKDSLTRLFVGSLTTLGLTIFIMIGTVVLGLIAGPISAIVGKWLDSIAMALVDMLIVLPAITIALVVLGFINNPVVGLCLVFIIGWLGRYSRYPRNLTCNTMTQPSIKFAPLSGMSKLQATIHHIVLHLISDIMTLVTIDFGKLMLSISGLAFIGLGVKPPVPELGAILHNDKSYFYSAPWLFVFPGVLLGGSALVCQILNRRHLY